MAKVHKVSLYITDTYGDSNIKELIENGLNDYDLYPEFIKIKSSKEFDWSDDLKINSIYCKEEDFENYFNS